MSEAPSLRGVIARSTLAGLQAGIVCGPAAAVVLVCSAWAGSGQRPDFSRPIGWLFGLGLTALVAVLLGAMVGVGLGLCLGVLIGLSARRLSRTGSDRERLWRVVRWAGMAGVVLAWSALAAMTAAEWGGKSLAVLLVLLLAATWWATGRVRSWYEQIEQSQPEA